MHISLCELNEADNCEHFFAPLSAMDGAEGYKSKEISISKYKKVHIDAAAEEQAHLTLKQKLDLKNLLNKFTL